MQLTKQQEMKVWAAVFGVVMYIFIAIVNIGTHPVDSYMATGFLCFLLLPTSFLILQRSAFFEGRTRAEIGGWRRRSWALYGDVFLGIAVAVSMFDWTRYSYKLPWWSQLAYWPLIAGLVGLGVGWLFRKGDNGRYDPRSLKGPAKWIHDNVLIPVIVGALVARALPLLWVWDIYAKSALALVGCWVVLAIIDGIRMLKYLPEFVPLWLDRLHMAVSLNPEQQHPHWDDVNFCVMYV